jgi:predicted membrane protein
MGGLTIGIILILLGISALTGVPLFNFIVAVILIAVGLRLITGRSSPHVWHIDNPKIASSEDSIDEVAIFSGLNKSFTTEHFKGGRVVMVFSGGDIDLTQAKADSGEIDLEVSSVFSHTRIVVPKEWKVRSTANVLLGMVNTRQAQGGDGPVTLTIRGEAAFGEIEIRK